MVARLGDLVCFCLLILENEADKLSSTQWFSAPNSVILGLMSTCMKIFMYKVVAVFLTPLQQKERKKKKKKETAGQIS